MPDISGNTGPDTLDIVVPLFNEADALASFHSQLTATLDQLPYRRRIVYVNDGSGDATAAELTKLHSADPTVHVIELSRNFGHQAALTAGLDTTEADIVIMMDGDGQHPPELIPEMIALYRQGYDIVQTQRTDTIAQTGLFKKSTAALFYELIDRIGELDLAPGTADFRLMSRDAVAALRQMPEYHRFMRGMVCWIGFRSILLPYQPRTRIAGASKYTFRKMLRFAGDGIFSFSLVPLKLALFLGGLCLLGSCVELAYVATFLLAGRRSELVPGWPSLIIVMTTTTGVIMLLLGIIGIYIGMIFQEVKQRPVYLVRSQTRSGRAAPGA